MGDQVVALDHGRVGQFDTPDAVFSRPASPNVAKALNCYNIFRGKIDNDLFISDDNRFRITTYRIKSADSSYAIRQDKISIRKCDAESERDEERIIAKYVTSAYTDSAFMYFFQTDKGAIIEVENHLSHRAMQN